jgi:hypothetical protein
MALIKCPECGKEISDKASACPNCGCPIASRPTSIKVRCLSDDRKVRATVFKMYGREVARVPIGSTATINISNPTNIQVEQILGIIPGAAPAIFKATPGACYETRYCKPGLVCWSTVVSEVSFIS